ncbi:MAG TPA: cytochrome c [Flavobacterium sp.]|nr:cytochrome c [Flavobacterium sp.]
MLLKRFLAITAFALILAGCTTDSTSDLIDATPIDVVTYNENVRTIFNNNCIICHGTIPANGAPMSLTTYALVKDAILNRPLIDRISRPQGAPGMMPNGGTRLPQSTIDLIIQWKNDGLQE